MTKIIILIFTVLCSLQVRAAVHATVGDTVRCNSMEEDVELFQPLQSSYLDAVIIPARGSGNWFVSIAGGANAFLGTPLGCEDLFGRIKPTYSLALGKWFTPSVGARINYNGLRFKNGVLATHDYHHIHADLMWNVLGYRYAKQDKVRWGLAPYVGLGLLHNADNGHNPLAVSYGIQGQYCISKRVSALVELSGTTTFQDFDGYGRANRLGDHMLSLTAGLSFTIGKDGWRRPVDPVPYIRRDQWLVDYANALSEQNKRYAGRHDKDRRTLAELKKILEIEGLLDTYNHLFNEEESSGSADYPVNNYSGLNSLRARLKNRYWDGKSVMEGQSSDGNVRADSLPARQDSTSGFVARHSLSPDSTEYVALMQSGSECVGAPIFFFFELGASRLTDASQSVNLDELARVAKKYNLYVKVRGAADSATGTADINNGLSASRADYIAAELVKRGIPSDHISKSYEGGISAYTPNEANRHTKVMLYFK